MEANGKGATAGRMAQNVMIYNNIVTHNHAIHWRNPHNAAQVGILQNKV